MVSKVLWRIETGDRLSKGEVERKPLRMSECRDEEDETFQGEVRTAKIYEDQLRRGRGLAFMEKSGDAWGRHGEDSGDETSNQQPRW